MSISTYLLAAAISTCSTIDLSQPVVSIIVDDLGASVKSGAAAIATTGVGTVAVMPHLPFTAELAHSAQNAGIDVILHLPMEPTRHHHALGPGALTVSQTRSEFVERFRTAVADVPGIVGISNHMGSAVTQDRERMHWLMDEIALNNEIVFVDSRTTAKTVAKETALAAHVRFLERDVFLDNQPVPSYVHAQLDELLNLARERGDAVGIAHPHRATLSVLNQRMPYLNNMRAVGIQELLRIRSCRQQATGSVRSPLAVSQGDQAHQ